MLTGQPEQHYLLSGSGGYGFIAKLGDMVGRVKAGKVVMTVDSGETVLPPIAVYASSLINPDCKVVLASSDHRLLAFSIGELKVMPKGRGLQLMSLTDGASLEHVLVTTAAEFIVETVGKRGAAHQENCAFAISRANAAKGKVLDISGRLKPYPQLPNKQQRKR